MSRMPIIARGGRIGDTKERWVTIRKTSVLKTDTIIDVVICISRDPSFFPESWETLVASCEVLWISWVPIKENLVPEFEVTVPNKRVDFAHV